MKEAHVVIVGSGVAARQLAKHLGQHLSVVMATQSDWRTGNSNLAQGGIAAALESGDSARMHAADTMAAGSMHNDPETVQAVCEAAPALIRELREDGCFFDENEQGELLLGMEGAHSRRRIVHSGGDATGRHLMDHFSACGTRATMLEHFHVFELLMEDGRCIGIRGAHPDGREASIYGRHIVLATGGCGGLYTHTSNAETVTGGGLALAYRAGARLTDMELIQFHPTLLFLNGKTHGLISEAVRGEGAVLVTEEGKPLMKDVHPMGDLAPRHIVAQSIYHHVRSGSSVYLDVSGIADFSARFPAVTRLCEQHGVDWRHRIPVAPGSHFLMGGIQTDLTGRTNVPGLYAIGEAACTGLHGANRLASNSLLEGLFMGKRLAETLNENHRWEDSIRRDPPAGDQEKAGEKNRDIPLVLPSKTEIRRNMMDRVGIIRTEAGLAAQKEWLERFDISRLLKEDLGVFSHEERERALMLITAWMVTDSAWRRTESRGGHFRQDYPCENTHMWAKRHIIQQRKEEHESTEIAAAT